tara:strand:- start:1815 stop:3200 length:1386 start_codon:yes stop_codon:yes gene_type:complete
MINFKNRKIYGWSKSNYSECSYLETSNIEQIVETFDFAKKNNSKIIFRGGGRSYGDNTLNKNNIVLKFISEKNIYSFNELDGEIIASGSCRLIDLLKFIIPKGWILNVSPASQFITIGGAISNNVHGKNCTAKGYFGDYVDEIEILTPDKGLIICTKLVNSELFYSAISGLGVFGVILKAKIKLRKIKTININTNINYVKNIDEAVEKTENLIKNHEYNIGSLNFTRFNKNSTDGKIYSSNFTEETNLSEINNNTNFLIYIINYILLFNKLPVVDKIIEYSFSKITSKKMINTKKIIENYYSMNFLGDKYLPLYNNFFRNGFIEYQVIFDKKYYLDAIHEIEILMRNNGYSSYMSSFKSYKASNEKYIFGLEKNGYCLTLDIPFQKGKKFEIFTRKINEITIKYKGQVYFGKTPCVNNQEFKAMYKNYSQFEKIKKIYDSNFLIVSEMSNRIFSDVHNYKY